MDSVRRKIRLFQKVIITISDELQLDKEMAGRPISATADPSKDVSFETMIVGLLTKQIFPDATILGFSRSDSFFRQDSEGYSFTKLTSEDVENFITKTKDLSETLYSFASPEELDLAQRVLTF